MRYHMDLVSSLNEQPDVAEAAAIELTKRAVRKLGRKRLAGGNCGMFALALADHLIEMGHQPKLGFIYRCPEVKVSGESIFSKKRLPCASVKEVAAAECDIYHVFVELSGNRFFDGTGRLSVDTLYEIAADQYQDDEPESFTDIDLHEPGLLSVIDNDTNWTMDRTRFYQSLIKSASNTA